MKDKHKVDKGCVTSYTNCIKYDGPSIPCLGIKTGDYINHIMCIIVNKICDIAEPMDLSSISLQCILDKFTGTTEPLSRTVSTFLQLLINNQCTLKDLIDAINQRLDGIVNPSLILDLKCLAIPDSQGNTAYTVQSVLQTLINEACSTRIALATLNGQILVLQQEIDDIDVYTEPLLTSCLYTSQPTSTALTTLANDYCTYKANVGTTSQISTAVGRQCAGLNTLFAANANFIQSPTTLAQTVNNQWITICNLKDRITALEACACKIDCTDIQLGFSATFTENSTVILSFLRGSGTNIPTGFTDCGSTVTIKNDNAVTTLPVSIEIAQDEDTIEIDISIFEQGEYLSINVNSKLCNGSMTCSQCTERSIRNTSGCCLITNTGEGNVMIIYKTCGIEAPTS